jgi:hypothetical protein
MGMRSLLLLCLAAGCTMEQVHGEPLAPSASGNLTVTSIADTTEFDSLELHWDRVDGTFGDPSTDVIRRADIPFVFPMEFSIGFQLGTSDASTYRLSAWFSNATAPTEAPAPDAPRGSVELPIGDCTAGCPTVTDVVLELAR